MEFTEAKDVLVGYVTGNERLSPVIKEAIKVLVDSDYNSGTTHTKAFYKDVINRLNVLGSSEQLNYYRNLFYKDGNSTIEGIIANAINDYVTNLVKQCSDMEPHRVPKVIGLDNYRATRCTYAEYENNSNCIEVNE